MTALPFPLCDDGTIFCLYARNGLHQLACRISQHKPGSSILVPAYSCGDEIEALESAGLTPVPYRVGRDLMVNTVDLDECFCPDLSAVLITHYFGLPQQHILQIKDWVKAQNLFLIEDCAHSLGGVSRGRELGMFGDASVFSFRKFIPIPHGGGLVINNQSLHDIVFSEPSPEALAFDSRVYSSQASGLFISGTPIENIYSHFGYNMLNHHGPRLAPFGGYSLGLPCSEVTQLKAFPWNNEFDKRQTRLERLIDIFSLNQIPGFIPLITDRTVLALNFPILVPETSSVIIGKIHSHGFTDCQPFWSFFHSYINWSYFPDATYLKQHIITIPLNHDIDFTSLKKAIACSI